MAHIVILGAGLTGLSAAYHLEKRSFHDFEIFEKEDEIGGLCRTVQENGYTFDYTGHLLHINDPYFKTFIAQTIGLENLLAINRRSYIYSHNTYTHYPFQINLHGLPPPLIAQYIEGYLRRKKNSNSRKDFMSWAREQFGTPMAHAFFIPYQRKIFAYDVKKITASWTGRFVPATSLKQMITGAIQEPQDQAIGYNAHFFYPKQGGIQSWLHSIAAAIEKPIRTSHTVEMIDIKTKKIYFTNGSTQSYTKLINTLPLDIFLKLLKEPTNSHVTMAADNLVCNSVVNFNLGIRDRSISDKHWIYFPEKEFPFYRLGFPHNFSPYAVPQGCSSLYGEWAHINKRPHDIEAITHSAIALTKKLLQIQDHEIAIEKIIHISHAYVIYTFWREKYLPHILKHLETFNVISTGRYGAWKYASMQEAVLDGKQAAETFCIIPAKVFEAHKRATAADNNSMITAVTPSQDEL